MFFVPHIIFKITQHLFQALDSNFCEVQKASEELQGMGFHLKEALLYSPPEPLQHKVHLITIPFLPKSDQHSIPPLNEKCTKDNPEGCTALVAKIKG